MAAFKRIETEQYLIFAQRYNGRGRRWSLVARNRSDGLYASALLARHVNAQTIRDLIANDLLTS